MTPGWLGFAQTSPNTPRGDLVLFDRQFVLKNISTQDAVISEIKTASGRALRVDTGQIHPWPGITLRAPNEHWNLANHGQVAVTLRNTGTNEVRVSCRVDNPGADGVKNCVTDGLALAPGRTGTLKMALKRASNGTLDGKLFGMRGYPVTPGGPGTVDPKNITQILLFVDKPGVRHRFELEDIRATGTYTPPTASVTDADPFFPFIDPFGQYKHRDWPGKVHTLAELTASRASEEQELAAQPGPREWDKFGGWMAGPQLTVSGFFRVEKYRGKWWLVDPEGHLFWSHGIDCVRALDTTPIDERAEWFDGFPGEQSEFRAFLTTGYALKGHYAGKSPKTFSFSGANLLRKYGPDWRQEYNEVIHRRLRSWGLNTIGNWSEETTRLMRRTAYTDAISSRGAKNIEGSEGYWGKFPDVFDPSFEAGVRRSMASRKGKSAGDPWCIGYFSDNEMSWGDDLSLALGTLKSPPEQAAKKVFVDGLRMKYGDIAKLNAAWGAKHESWDALRQSREAPNQKLAHTDLTEFYTKAAEQYFRTVREAVQSVAPNQLYLGCRFAWVNERAAIAAGKYCDIVSYNLYKRGVADFKYPGGDKPLMIGEFHFGALDRGMFHTGLVPVANQAERAKAYRDYVLGAARHPQFVGTHWFQWKDEPVTGRVYDEENYQIGFVDITDTPYRETIEASREVGKELYRNRLEDKTADFPELVLPQGIGVNIHFTRGHDQDLDLMAAAGIKFIRMDFGWSGTERKKGEYSWADYDSLTANLEKRGIRAIYILDYSNPLYEETVVGKNPITGQEHRDVASPQHPESVAAFARWAGASAKHFAGRRIIWEIWNEPNISFWKPKPDVKQYIALASAAAQAVREADPKATIIGPATSEVPMKFIEECFAAGMLSHLDAVSVHPYRPYKHGPETAAEDYTRLRALIEKYAPTPEKRSMPIISGEWGYSTFTNKGVSLETQAAFLVRQQLANLHAGVPISIWYDWKNDGPDLAEREHNFGTVTPDLTPKPAYAALQILTRELSGFRIEHRLGAGQTNDFVLLLSKGAEKKLAAWTTGEPHSASVADLKFKSATSLHGDGQTADVKLDRGQLSLTLVPMPQYVTLKP